ncbi:MAG: 30S ribosomal protein S12 methylthiotransferase RimO [Anaerolineae bacterium]|jgi:ribosomal protein S12 methylthiotransferase|nr:30S ribosomal protein S12 methylthiotransferase RimO [Anaerolineae bacterium]
MKFYLESLGCPKNLVDAHGMTRLLVHLGHRPVEDLRRAQVLIVNTCGFVEDARAESLGELRQLARKKRPGQVLIAAGCLSQLWGEELMDEVPGIDAVLGTRRWHEIGSLVHDLRRGQARGRRQQERMALLGDGLPAAGDGRQAARQGVTAYLRIADGCSAPCAFCTIPRIKGPAASRPAGEVVAEAAELAGEGVRELILIAQDTTAYGRDRGETDALPGLLQSILAAAPGLDWLRLMYAYPGRVSPRLVEVMAGDPRVCRYLDLPLQHAHPDVLRRMKRPADVERTRRLVEDLRAAMPDLSLRTTFIVGYPGESEAEFQALLDFVAEVRFDRVGAFTFSPEEGTPAAELPGALPEEVKVERYERLMALQQGISRQINEAQVGRTLDVLLEGQGDGLSVGRSYRDAPEIDGMVILTGELPVGSMLPVRITGAMEYDLLGESAAAS